MQITTIGSGYRQDVFQVHGIDAAEKVIVRNNLVRRMLAFFKAFPACLWACKLRDVRPRARDRRSLPDQGGPRWRRLKRVKAQQDRCG